LGGGGEGGVGNVDRAGGDGEGTEGIGLRVHQVVTAAGREERERQRGGGGVLHPSARCTRDCTFCSPTPAIACSTWTSSSPSARSASTSRGSIRHGVTVSFSANAASARSRAVSAAAPAQASTPAASQRWNAA